MITNEQVVGSTITPPNSDTSAGFTLPGDPYAAGVGFGIVQIFTVRPSVVAGFYRLVASCEFSTDGGGSWSPAIFQDLGVTMAAVGGEAWEITLSGIVDAAAAAVPLMIRGSLENTGASVGDIFWNRVRTTAWLAAVSSV